MGSGSFLRFSGIILAAAVFLPACKTNLSSDKQSIPTRSNSTTTTIPAAVSGSPTTPSGLSAVGLSSTTIQLTWTDNSTDETGFQIYRATTSGGPYTFVGTAPASTPATATGTETYTDIGLTANTTYYYVINAINGVGPSSATAEVSAITLVTGAPSNLTARPRASGSVQLSWTDNSNLETAFLIQRSFTGATGTFVDVAYVPASETKYTDGGLFPSTSYFYQVTAVGLVPTATSNTASVTTFSGAWRSIGNSASGNGVSGTASENSSMPSVASDGAGATVMVWQEDVNGVDQIYAAVYTDANAALGWKGIITSATTVTASYEDTDGDGTNDNLSSVTYGTTVFSNEGRGISFASGDAQEPSIVYSSANNAYYVSWQELRNGNFEIMGRAFRNLAYRSFSGTNFWAARGAAVNTTGMSGQTVTDQANPAAILTNIDQDVLYSTAASVWQISNPNGAGVAQGYETIRSKLAVVGTNVFSVYEAFVGSKWNIYGTQSDVSTISAAAPAAAQVAVYTGFATSRSVDGLSGTPVAGAHARYPTIAIQDATHIYFAWQQRDTVATPNNYEVYAAIYDGAGAVTRNQVNTVNTGDSMRPQIAVTGAGLPVVAWEDNSNGNNFDIYVRVGDVNAANWVTINDGTISSGDTATTGISDNTGQSQFPSISTYSTDIFVAWQDSTDGIWNIMVKRYSTLVPGEGPAWIGMADSDEPPGVSENTDGATVNPTIRANSGGVVNLVWQYGSTTSRFNTYLKRW